jgi:RNA polymerase sigma factor (sigma-70 family)
MATPPSHPLGRYVRQLAAAHLAAALSDRQLLERFTLQGDEVAFAALVRRYGPLVLGVCRRVLRDWHAAEDACQCTFLVLARRAQSIRRPESLGPWLHGVAVRTALKARARAARRRACERAAAAASTREHAEDAAGRDLRPVLDEAVAQLPEKYRVPLVLCYLHGRTVSEVARQLGCPRGTVATRLTRGRELLRARLARRGLGLSAGALAAGAASAAVPAAWAARTAEAAVLVAAGGAVTGVVSTQTVALLKGVLNAMFLTKLKVAVAVSVAVGAVVGLGIGLGLPRTTSPHHAGARPTAAAPAAERFYAGGFRSLRGFEMRGVGPKATEHEGGDFLFLNSLEYQVPIRANDRLFPVGFVDSGTVGERPDVKDDRASAGAGVQLVVPMLGPVPTALDFGFPVVKEPSQPEQIFGFWLGFFR